MWINTWFDLATSPEFVDLSTKAVTLSGSYISTLLRFLPYFLIFSFVLFIANFLLRKFTWSFWIFAIFKSRNHNSNIDWYKQETQSFKNDFKHLRK